MRRVGIIGAGYIAAHHLRALRALDDVHIVAVCDVIRERAEKLVGNDDTIALFDNIDKMLNECSFDVVHVVVPAEYHVEVATKVILSGSHVFIEKPLGISVKDCEQLIQLSREKKMRIGVNHNFLFFETYEATKQAINDGQIGPLNYVSLNWHKTLQQIFYGPYNSWMINQPHHPFLEIAPHILTCLIHLVGFPNQVRAIPSDSFVMTNGRSVYRQWLIEGISRNVPFQIRVSIDKGFEVFNLYVGGKAGVAQVDFECNVGTVTRHTSYSRPFDIYKMIMSKASQMKKQARVNIWNYIANKLKFRSFGEPYSQSIAHSITRFYADLEEMEDFRHSPDLALKALMLAEEITKEVRPNEKDVKPETRRKEAATTLVLGGSGFIGQALIRKLIQENQKVRVLVRDPDKLSQFRDDIEIVKGDLSNFEDLKDLFKGITVVYHLARAQGNQWSDYLEGVDTTKRIAQACLENGIKRLVYTSTTAAYYGGNKNEIITEETPLDPQINKRNLYTKAKALEENYLNDLYANEGLPVVIIRPGIVIGPGTSPFHWGVGMWYCDSNCDYWGDGKNLLPLVLVDDVAEGLYLAAIKENIEGESFNFIDTPYLSARDYLKELANYSSIKFDGSNHAIWRYFINDCFKWGIKKLVRHPGTQLPSYRDWKSRTQSAKYDCTKARNVLGWKPADDRQKLIEIGIKLSAQKWFT